MNAGRMNLLEQEDFNAFFSGCLRTVQSDSGLLLHRHTAKQIAYYEETNESWAIRSRCPAGIKLNLHLKEPAPPPCSLSVQKGSAITTSQHTVF